MLEVMRYSLSAVPIVIVRGENTRSKEQVSR